MDEHIVHFIAFNSPPRRRFQSDEQRIHGGLHRKGDYWVVFSSRFRQLMHSCPQAAAATARRSADIRPPPPFDMILMVLFAIYFPPKIQSMWKLTIYSTLNNNSRQPSLSQLTFNM